MRQSKEGIVQYAAVRIIRAFNSQPYHKITSAQKAKRTKADGALRFIYNLDRSNRQPKVALIRTDAHRSIHMDNDLDFFLAWCCMDRSCNGNRLIAVANSHTRACLAVYCQPHE
jgi:hypothetical protein